MYDVFMKLLQQRGVRVSDVSKATGNRSTPTYPLPAQKWV